MQQLLVGLVTMAYHFFVPVRKWMHSKASFVSASYSMQKFCQCDLCVNISGSTFLNVFISELWCYLLPLFHFAWPNYFWKVPLMFFCHLKRKKKAFPNPFILLFLLHSLAVYMCEMERHQPQDFQHKDQECWYPVANPIPAASGVTYELCAGIVDHPELSLEEIACKEVLEECGYDVPISHLKRITSYR